MKYTVVIPVLNQLHYTQQCVQSLLCHGVEVSSLLIIDNGSTDDTPAWLASRPDLRSIRNPVNLGCGGAWTQGALASDSDWVVLLNNDIVCGHNFIEAQIEAAQKYGLEVVSPSMVEFELDYDLAAFTPEFLAKMRAPCVKAGSTGCVFRCIARCFTRLDSWTRIACCSVARMPSSWLAVNAMG